jgi:hypothetical protein
MKRNLLLKHLFALILLLGFSNLYSQWDVPTNFATINAAVAAAPPGSTINVAAGNYNEDVVVNKQLTIKGAGIGVTTVSGPIGGAGSTFQILASGVIIEGFTITRDGNNPVDWNNPGLNTAGISIQGLSITGAIIRKNKFTGLRTGIDINNSNGHFIEDNVITFNRTGLIFRNQTDNMTVSRNDITDNWTVGVLFLDASLGSNSPVQGAINGAFNNNNISSNWYGGVVDRQTGGSLALPGANPKSFTCNWWGTLNPVVTNANSAEPGYAAQIPAAYGGAATNPGGAPDIAGPASANIIYIPYLNNGTDNDAITPGFQPVPGSCSGGTHVHNTTQGTHYITIQAAVSASNSGDVIEVDPGTYNENVSINKSLSLRGANYGLACPRINSESIVSGGAANATFRIQADNVSIDGFTIKNPLGHYGVGVYNSSQNNLNVQHNIITDVGNNTTGSGVSYGVYFEVGTPANSDNVNISNNCINFIRGGDGGGTAGSAAGVYIGSSSATKELTNLVVNGNKIDNITARTNATGGKGAYGILINTGASSAVVGKVTNAQITNNEINTLNGLWAHGIGLEGETPGALVTNNLIHDLVDNKGNTDAVGVRVEDNDGSGSVSINYNSLTNTAFAISNKTSATVNGTCNWYGTTDNSVVATKIEGNVSHVPYLIDGTDANPSATGFQPVANSCRGYEYVDCGKKEDKKVVVCHNGKSLCISVNALDEHLSHGDLLGNCVSQPITQTAPLEMTEALLGVTKLQVTPNPSIGQFTLRLNNLRASKAQILLLDQNGRTIEQRSIQLINGQQNVIYNTRKFASGMYIVKVVSEDGVQTSKVVIQH